MPDNGTTQLVTRQGPARARYECAQERGLGAGQPHLSAVAIDKDLVDQVELAVIDSQNHGRWGTLVFLVPCRWSAKPIEKLLLIQCFHRTWIYPARRRVWSENLVRCVPQYDRPWNNIAQLAFQAGQRGAMHDDCRFNPSSRSQFERPLLALGKLDGTASRLQQARNFRTQLDLLRCN
jgi:hypothetical protein